MLLKITEMLDRLGGGLAKILNLIGGVALVALIPAFAWLVFGRYVLNETPTWVEQFSLILIVLITFPVAAAGMRDNSHLSVSFFRDSLPPKAAAVMAAIGYAAMVVFGFYMLMGGIDLVAFNWSKQMPIIHISDGWRSVPMAVCGAGILFYSVVHILKIITGWQTIAQSRFYSDDLLDKDAE
ncbi:TRAP transporter small permease [Thalassospira alkalitolerans]|uniref:TRAP transporter small permease protein n=1 Tax=Thalassospira alkalitolerans TaxID=1293890 RepID=A0A1Y2LAX2_9PROT|nr:TRAP transporter small permease [Thalassospira alkalitolerans]OSQ47746.1 C4-dicarboxylate ABC transporter permease [Thalassospira alkalitolerans]|tara:strand:- start:12345 stop:12890 length:546 start_codon:yes stop_codon:yes gene_type:complete